MGLIQDRIVAVKYLLGDSNADKESYVANAALSNVKMNIQPASEQLVALTDGVFGYTFVGYTTTSGIAEGNYLTVSGTGETYLVKSLADWSYPKIVPHYQFVLEKIKE